MKLIHIPATAFFFMFMNCYSQSKLDTKIRFKSISTGLGICSGEINTGGICAYIDATASIHENLFSLAISSGSEFNLFDASRNYNEIAFLYGRELNLSRIIKLETLVGIAHFKVSYKNGDTDFILQSKSAIGFPIKLKLLFNVSKHFAFGLNPNVTFNAIENTYSANHIFQYNF